MQNVKVGDLKFDALTSSTQQLIKDLQSARQELEKTFTQAFRDAAAKSEPLQAAFKELNINADKMSVDKIGDKLTKGLQTAQSELQKTANQLDSLKQKQDDLQAKIGNAQGSIFNTTNAQDIFSQYFDPNKAKQASSDISSWVEEIKAKLIAATSSMKNDSQKEVAKSLIDNIVPTESKDQIQIRIQTVVDAIANGAKNLNDVRDQFNISNKTSSKASIIESILGTFDFKSFDASTLKGQLQEFLNQFGDIGLSGDQRDKLLRNVMGLTDQDIEGASNKIIDALVKYREKFQKELNSMVNQSTTNQQKIEDLTPKLNDLSTRVSVLEGGKQAFGTTTQDIQRQFSDLEARVKNLEDNLLTKQGQSDSRTVNAGKEAVNAGTKGFEDNAKAAQQYTQQLERVKEAEKMVGKIEGIAQRWFSIYAAVNMVTKAISSMKATIAELDKTITEIAIVTNMSQGDLWGQMDTYTAMAREYASSISGVYKVSQLYYQQGLQTKEVMELTEQTLKMARISGLDYAEATNYMTNAVRSFKMEMSDAQRVVDVYSAIAAKSATDVAELAVAMSKTASSAEAVGSSFENTTAMMAVMIEATRESSQNIGSAMKSIISRYGEMKADPSKLVDSEGEEMSLNKVDTALRSVGISIQNAQGQFRDFDDVIMELAEAWDTIDINTQRYIATVMAGNRQQSRFLALVSNGERLKQLSEEAANAENASQLQFLKTLDSIEAKSQQLQTSLQSLYTSSGLENFYKGILDISNAIIKTFSDMPTIFNLPIPAIINFGTTFYSLANVVTSVFSIIINKYAAHISALESLGKQTVANETEIQGGILSRVRQRLKQEIQAEKAARAEIKAIRENPDIPSPAESGSEEGKSAPSNGKQRNISAISLTASVAGLALSGLGTALKSSKDSGTQQLGGIFGALGQGASMAGMGFTMGGPMGAAIGGIAGLAMGVVQNIDSIVQTGEKRLATLTEIASEAKNKVLQEEAEAKSLQTSIDKLKELEKARYDSAEAEKAYLEASDTLAKQYPELINAYDETGKALINTESASELLISSLKEVVSATEAASTANFKLALERYKQEQQEIDQIKNSEPTETTGHGSKGWQLLKTLESNQKEIGDDATLLLQDYWGSNDIGGYLIRYAEGAEKELSEGFSNYIDSYLNKTLEVFSQQKPEIDTSKLDPVESILYNHIESLINEYASLPSREEANKKNLQMSAKANLMSDIDAYLSLIEAVEKDNPFEGMSESAALIKNYVIKNINTEELDTPEEWESAKNGAQEATQEYFNTLKNWYKDINKETYKGVMAFKGKVSSKKLIEMLREAFPGIEDNIIEAFEETFTDSLDAAKFSQALRNFDNFDIASILGKYSAKIFDKLSDAERQQLLNYGKQIEQSIAGGALTQQQGENNLKAYLNIWQQLGAASITDKQREAAEELLRTWDGTKEGLEAIKESLPEGEAAKGVLEAINKLIPLISQNLNTIFQNLSTSIATSIKNLDDAVKDLSKGVSIDKAVEYATKLGVDLSKFELDYSTGLWKYNDLNQIQQKYFENIDTQISDAKTMLQQYTDNSVDIKQLIGMSEVQRSGQVGQALYDILGRRGLDKTEVDSIITIFEATDKKVDEFDSWLVEHYTDILKTLNITQENAQARAALSLGNLTGFLSNALNGILVNGSDVEKIITSLVANGGINETDLEANGVRKEIINALLKYSNLLSDTFKDTTQNVYNKAIESITKGEQEIEVTDTNESLLNELGITDEIKRNGKRYRKANWSGMTVGSPEYTKAVNKLLVDGITEEEKSILEALENALTRNNPAQVLDEITGSWQEVGQTAALLFKSVFNLSDTDFNKIFSFDEISKTYTTDLKALREKIRNNDKLSQKQRNEQLAKIDKELRDTSVQTTFSDLVKNANNLSEDTLRAWADSIGASYEAYANLWRQKDGTYKIDLAGLVQNKKALETLEQGGVEFAAGVLDSVIDEYLGQLSNISQAQTSGYTNLGDMRAVADQFANGDLGIFEWDKELKAYILTNEGIMRQAKTAADQLKSLDKDSQEYKKALQLMQADGQALAENIDFLGLIGVIGSDQFTDEAKKFTDAVENYNYYLTGIGEEVGLSAEKLLSLAQKGGLSAVKAAQDIAERAGKKLEGSDVETIYRSGANKINTALEQVNLSVGSVIDSTTVELLGIQGQVTDLGSGKYVINSSIDLVEAHQQLLRAMYEDNTYTLSELNALQAKVMAGNEQADLLESMSNISELTYDTLGQIAEQAGYSLYSLYGELTKNNAVKNLGGGKIRITDFDYFADLIGLTDRSSEEYIQVLSKYNDEVISYNRSRADAVVSELKTVSEANAGDQINITNLWSSLTDEMRYNLEGYLLSLGTEINNGIIKLGNKNTTEVLSALLSATDSLEGIAERDKAEIEDAFETLLNNITEQIKQGLEGKLSNVGKIDLQNSLKSTYGVELKDSDFAKTADGFKMTEQAAIRVYNTMKDMDALQASLVLTELNNSLKESNENYKSMGDIMNHIAQLQKEINDPKVSPERKQMYQEELEVAKEIAQVRATTDDSSSFAFMNNKLPGAMENPLTYAENWGKAINILQKKSSGDKKGFIDARDWYNIVNEMNNIAGMGQKIKMYGVELDGSLKAASELIQKGYNELKSIDGGKMQVDLSKLGVAFETGAMDMKGNVTKGIHAMADSQIKMLDGLIALLETIVAMQEAFAGINAGENETFDLEELFDFGIDKENVEGWIANNDFKDAADALLKKAESSKDLKKAIDQIKINGIQLSELLTQARDKYAFAEKDARALTAAMDALYKASLSGNYDTDNIYESVKEVLRQSGAMDGEISIDIGDTTLYLTGNIVTSIDWKSDKVKNALKDSWKGKKEKEKKKLADEAMRHFAEKPESLLQNNDTNAMHFILNTSSEVTFDEKEKKYIVDGHKFDDETEAYRALVLKTQSQNAKLTFEKDKEGKEKLTGATIESTTGTSINMKYDSEGNIIYTYIGPDGSEATSKESLLDAIRNYWSTHSEGMSDQELEDVIHSEAVNLKIDSSTGITFEGKDKKGEKRKPTLDETRKAQELLNDPNITTYEELRDKAKELDLPIKVDSSLKGDLSVDDMKKVAELFGVDYQMEAKQVSLSVSLVDTPDPIQDLLNSTEPIQREVELKVTSLDYNGGTEGEPIEGEGGNGGEGTDKKKPLEISAPVHLSANPLEINPGQDGPTGGSTAPIDIKGAVFLTPTFLSLDPKIANTAQMVASIIKIIAPTTIKPNGEPTLDLHEFITDDGINWPHFVNVLANLGLLTLSGESTGTDLSGATAKASKNALSAEGLLAALKLTGESESTDLSGVTAKDSPTALSAAGKIAALMLTGTSSSTDLTGATSTTSTDAVDATGQVDDLTLTGSSKSTDLTGVTGATSTDTVNAEGGVKDLTLTGSPNSTDVSQITGAKSEGTVDAGAAAGALLLWYAAGTTDPEIITGGPVNLTDEEITAASDLAKLSLNYIAGGTAIDPITGLPAEGVPGGIVNVLAEIGHILLNDGSTESGSSVVGLSTEFKQKVAALVNSIATAQNLTPKEKYSAYAQIKEILADPANDGIEEKLINDIISKFGLNNIILPEKTVTQPFKIIPVVDLPNEKQILENLYNNTGMDQIGVNETGEYEKYFDALASFGAKGGSFNKDQINGISQFKYLLEQNRSPENDEVYNKYFGDNGIFTVSQETNGEIKITVNTENLSEEEKNIVENGKADGDITTAFTPQIKDATAIETALLENGAAEATLTVNIKTTGDKLPGEEGDEDDGDSNDDDSNDTNNNSDRAENTGNEIGNGVGKGLANSNIGEYINQFVSATITDINSGFGVASPATELIPTGEYTAAGIGEGMKQYNFSGDVGTVVNSLTSALTGSINGVTDGLGEKLISIFGEDLTTNIGTTAEALQKFSETDAVSNPSLSTTLGNLAKEALTICGVDAGQLERLYHILENLPGAANTFANDANWQNVVKIIQQLSQTNNGEGGEGFSIKFESTMDDAAAKLLGLDGQTVNVHITGSPTSDNGGGNPNNGTGNPNGIPGQPQQLNYNPNGLLNQGQMYGVEQYGTGYRGNGVGYGEAKPTNMEETSTTTTTTTIEGGQIDIDSINTDSINTDEITASTTSETNTTKTEPESEPTEAPKESEAEEPELNTSSVDGALDQLSQEIGETGEAAGTASINMGNLVGTTGQFASETQNVASGVGATGQAAGGAIQKINDLSSAINRIPDKTTIGIDAHVDLEVTASITEEKKGDAPAKGNADVDIKMGETSLSQSDFTISKAKGTNLALPKGNATTLMGELGPELYVSNGRYQVVGQNGAEFVDLPKDAIVFNHKKTAQLLKNGHMSGRGRPFTNISNALSFAKGSLEGGPAMASAAAALAALKQLRAMWASMLNASAKDLGSQAGRGGGGGGKDENGNYKQPTNVIKDIERWYNLERQIANLEKEITYQQKLQAKYESDRVANGDKIFDAQKRQYDLLGREIIRQQELAKLQRSWYDNKRKELEESSYGKIFTYDENGLQQYVGTGKPGSGLGLDILENLTRRNVNGQAIGHAKTAKSQLKYLQSLGFDLNDLIYNDDGTKVVKKVGKNLRLTKMEGDEDTDDEELYAKMMENFWNNLDGWKEELDSLYDGIQDTLNEIEENQKKQNEIYQDWINNDIDVRNKLRDAIVNREQAVIDKLQEQKDALEESTERFIDGLNDALEKDKQRSDENKADQELTKLQRQLSILQRSGGSATQIKQLQDQISQKQEDMYFDERQKQIEAIQEASDKEIERLDQQIELLTDTLEYQKENGLLWNEVELLLQQGQEAATAFYAEWGIDQSQSALEQAENVRKIQEQFQKSDKFNEQKEKDQAEADWIDKIKNGKNATTNANILGAMTPDDQKAAEERAKLAAQDAKEDYLKKNPDDEDGANKAAEDAYTKSLLDTYRETDAGKEVVKNFDSNYDTWLKNRQLSDINDFTNKEGFQKNQTTFKQAMEEYYLLHKNDKDENGNLIDENTLWKESIQAGQAAIHDSLGESLNQEGTLSKSAAKYTLDTNSNKFIKTTDTFPAKSVFNFDETRKAGSKNYLHIAGYKENEGWIRASQVKNGSNIVKLVKKGQEAIDAEETADLSTAVVSGGDNDYYSSAAEASFILQGYTKKEIKDNWLGGTEFNKKGGGTIKASEKNNAVRISDVTGIKFKDKNAPEKGIKAAGKVIVDAIQPEGYSEMVELASTKPSSIGSGKQAKINSFINAKDSEMLRKIKYLMAYKEGGMAYATGPAWLDGTKTKPEAVLNAKQTEFLKHDLLGSQNDSLMSMVHQLQDIYEQNSSNISNISNNDIGTFIERIDVTFESGVIRDDYDMKRASNMFKNELLRIARKTTTVNVKRR